MSYNVNAVRARFPALKRPVVFFDNPGGTQIVDTSLKAIQHYLVECNANHAGAFATSRESDAIVDSARAAAADFLNAAYAEEIIFGPNMTTLTYRISRALARNFQEGDTIVVTHMDHDANISPWVQAAEDRGCKIRWVKMNPEDCTLDMEDLREALAEKPKLLAIGYASNAVGTIHPLQKIIPMAHDAGALVYIDAVQYVPHGLTDVQKLDCDFLVCSAYKFFGPHMGILYGRHQLLENLQAYRVRPAPTGAPGKFETGTNNFEAISGLLGVLDYLQWIGDTFGSSYSNQYAADYKGRRLLFKQAMRAIQDYETEISLSLIQMLNQVPGAKIYGVKDPSQLDRRVPTFGITLEGRKPRQVAQHLGDQGIYVWNGHFYALATTEYLGIEEQGGLIRIGPAHYNTLAEINRLEKALQSM
jgi:cysteine desulfurase family protein (TIGR01976 family)